MDIERYIEGLSPELQEKARTCTNTDQLLKLAKDEGVALPDEALTAIAGGTDEEVGSCCPRHCPRCGSGLVVQTGSSSSYDGEKYHITYYYKCSLCSTEFQAEETKKA